MIPEDAELAAWPDGLPKWDTLDPEAKKLYIRQAEVYAAYLAYTDHEIGRVIRALEDVGKLDNTLVIYISGDNGASPGNCFSSVDGRHAPTRFCYRRNAQSSFPAQPLATPCPRPRTVRCPSEISVS